MKADVFAGELLPTDKDVSFMRTNGWLLSQLFVRDAYLEKCAEAVEEVYSAKYDCVYSWSAAKANAGFNEVYLDRTKPRIDAYVSLHKRKVGQVLHAPELAAYAATLMDAAEVRLFRDIILTMPAARGDGTGWHVDKNYWTTCSSDRLLTAWFSLQDCDEANGCLTVISGSHLWRRTTFVHKIPLADIDAIQKLFGKERREIEVTPVPHKRGQISFHSCLVLHGAMPNLSGVTRQSFAAVYQDGANCYVAPATAKARLLNFNTNDHVGPRDGVGLPDYRNAQFYPLLYSAETAGRES